MFFPAAQLTQGQYRKGSVSYLVQKHPLHIPLPPSETHTQGFWSGLRACTCTKFSANPPPFLSQARGRDRVTVQRRGLENIVCGTPKDPKSWRIQMAGLQRHQEPSSREIDPSCKIIRLLIAPARSYKLWIQACFHHFLPSSPFFPSSWTGHWLVLAGLPRRKAFRAGWRETEPACEFWTEDKSKGEFGQLLCLCSESGLPG